MTDTLSATELSALAVRARRACTVLESLSHPGRDGELLQSLYGTMAGLCALASDLEAKREATP